MSDTNLLHDAHSPYLLQHAGNPVHWRQWNDAALAEARSRGVPILLSIGYAACHWCHVMAHESFEDAETAALMNRYFVSIKVDREERPDIDHIYMSALHALGEAGGWPLTMFLTPDAEPFWGGTYFPPEPRWGRPSFRQVLLGVARAFAEGDGAVTQNAAALRAALHGMAAARPGAVPGPAALGTVAAALLAGVDPVHGGLRGAPRFPNAPLFRFLWQNAARSGDDASAEAVHTLLRGLALGGIHDHLGGGFARYSTDAEWLVPHFEKMLYDNAQILELLALAHAARPDPLTAVRAEELVGWLVREMLAAPDAAGRRAFASAQDADSEGEEGRFYVWTEAEIDAVLGSASPAFKAAYDVRPEGNWEGRTVLRRLTPPGGPAEERALAEDRRLLFEARARRVPPTRDGKVLADWNGLAIAALARAAAVFSRPDWLSLATAALDFVRTSLAAPNGRVAHAWAGDRITAAGLLEDQAAIGLAALALYEATGEGARLEQAAALGEAAIAHFADADGSMFQTADDAADVPVGRPRNAADNATPSGTGLIATLLARLYHLTGAPVWRSRADAVLRAFGGAASALGAMPTLLAAADLLEDAITVVIAGDPHDPANRALLHAARVAP
ncbi:MAG TPA: thioredoxin domain-containing protein, partial [Acetobacteraceae bacterium]|nr:thioredoxin domain-containing protein [Acetobacteraceae bacterium]